MRVLSWNVMHGRSVPPAGRYLFEEFASALAEWDWEAALLQEVPPWWPQALALRMGCEQRLVLTSRNFVAPLRRWVAIRRPDLIKSNGGGCNAILVRTATIVEHRRLRLCWLPERRWMHAVLLGGRAPVWLANLHATVRNDSAARDEARAASQALIRWADEAPAVLGGDFNVREFSLPGFTHAGGHDVDHVFVRGLSVRRPAFVLERGNLSDHAPILVETATY